MNDAKRTFNHRAVSYAILWSGCGPMPGADSDYFFHSPPQFKCVIFFIISLLERQHDSTYL